LPTDLSGPVSRIFLRRRALVEILRRHFRNEREMGRAPRFFGGEETLERLIAETPHPAKEVHFVGRNVGTDAVGGRRDRLSTLRDIRRCAGTIDTAVGVESGNERQPDDPKLRANLLHVQHRDAQIAVVLEREPDQRLQSGVAEKFLQPTSGAGKFVGARSLATGETPLVSGHWFATGDAGRS